MTAPPLAEAERMERPPIWPSLDGSLVTLDLPPDVGDQGGQKHQTLAQTTVNPDDRHPNDERSG